MSIANPARRRAQGGYTFIEVAVTLAIVSLMALVIERTLASTNDASRHLSAIRKATERGQNLAYEIREAVSASRKLFGNDVTGQGYWDALDLTRDPPDSTARLPLFDEVNPLGPDDVGDPRTGNILLFVREADAAPAVADPATGKIRFIDTYRFICIYPRETTRYVVQDEPRQLAKDLVVWRSEAYPSYPQIMAISDVNERENAVRDLYDRFGYDLAWDPNSAVADAFHAMDGLGTITSIATPSPTVDEDLNISDRGRLVYTNAQLARTNNLSHPRRAVFTVEDPGDWAPDGFVVKVAGASGSRKVWMHLVIEVPAFHGRVATHQSTVIASTKDL